MKINRKDLDKKNITYKQISEKEYIIVYKYNGELYQLIPDKFPTLYGALNYIQLFPDKLLDDAYTVLSSVNTNKKTKSKKNKRKTKRNKKAFGYVIITVIGTLIVGMLITLGIKGKKKGTNKSDISIPTPTNTYETTYTPTYTPIPTETIAPEVTLEPIEYIENISEIFENKTANFIKKLKLSGLELDTREAIDFSLAVNLVTLIDNNYDVTKYLNKDTELSALTAYSKIAYLNITQYDKSKSTDEIIKLGKVIVDSEQQEIYNKYEDMIFSLMNTNNSKDGLSDDLSKFIIEINDKNSEYNKLDQGSKYLLSIQIQTMLNTNNFNNNISKEYFDRLVIEIQNAQAVTSEFIRQNVSNYNCRGYNDEKSYSKVRSL